MSPCVRKYDGTGEVPKIGDTIEFNDVIYIIRECDCGNHMCRAPKAFTQSGGTNKTLTEIIRNQTPPPDEEELKARFEALTRDQQLEVIAGATARIFVRAVVVSVLRRAINR